MTQLRSRTSRSAIKLSPPSNSHSTHNNVLNVAHLMHEHVCRWGSIEFPMPFGRVMSPTESFIHSLDEKV